METIAITEWNGVVSPLFDAACTWYIVRGDGGNERCTVKDSSLIEKVRHCSARGVTVIICGAISAHARSLLEDEGIRIIPWVCGTVSSIIETFKNGEDIAVRFAMPGCRGRCRGKRHRGGHRGRNRKEHTHGERNGLYENSGYGN